MLKPILIGNGFPASGKHPKYYPKDRLIKFLNLNPKNTEEVWKYCKDYIFLPREGENLEIWLKSFQEEYKEISSIAKRAVNNLLTEKDRRKINRIRRNIRPELQVTTGEQLSEMNLDLGGVELDKDKKSERYYSEVKHYYGSIVSLWEDLAKHIVNNQDVKQCLYCGQFFAIAPRSHGQKFCTGTNCQNSYNHKKSYSQKRMKKIKA